MVGPSVFACFEFAFNSSACARSTQHIVRLPLSSRGPSRHPASTQSPPHADARSCASHWSASRHPLHRDTFMWLNIDKHLPRARPPLSAKSISTSSSQRRAQKIAQRVVEIGERLRTACAPTSNPKHSFQALRPPAQQPKMPIDTMLLGPL